MNYDDNINNQISEVDREFVRNAADGSIFQIKAGEIAVTKGDTTPIVRMVDSDSLSVGMFGKMMITDHTKINNQLRTLAKKNEVSIPIVLSASKQQKLDSLMVMSGKAFNTEYAKMMVSSHQETVNLFKTEASSGTNRDFKSWASEKLPILQQHLDMATSIRDAMK